MPLNTIFFNQIFSVRKSRFDFIYYYHLFNSKNFLLKNSIISIPGFESYFLTTSSDIVV